MTGAVGNDFDIEIPAYSKDHEMELVTYVLNESDLYSLMPHMHFRGKRMKFLLSIQTAVRSYCYQYLIMTSIGN